eukprot:14372154-Ditylum_brightwellii.AAC.1
MMFYSRFLTCALLLACVAFDRTNASPQSDARLRSNDIDAKAASLVVGSDDAHTPSFRPPHGLTSETPPGSHRRAHDASRSATKSMK